MAPAFARAADVGQIDGTLYGVCVVGNASLRRCVTRNRDQGTSDCEQLGGVNFYENSEAAGFMICGVLTPTIVPRRFRELPRVHGELGKSRTGSIFVSKDLEHEEHP